MGLGNIKGTAQRDFLLTFSFIERLNLISIDTPKSDFEFCRIFVELLFEIPKNRLPTIIDSGE